MLLSDASVAEFVSNAFEPAWQSVRAVPRVTIDFGEGHILRRTLHGNIATYVCAPDGVVLDLIPGLYDTETYASRLRGAARLARDYAAWPEATRAASLRAVHAAAPSPIVVAKIGTELLSKFRVERATEETISGEDEVRLDEIDSKRRIENPTEEVVASSFADGEAPHEPRVPLERITADGTRIDIALLARDTAHNETVRRPQVSALLAEAGRHTPESLTRRVYREILDADLDDPYLGLGDALFDTYPFLR